MKKLENVDWKEVFETKDVNVANGVFEEILRGVLDSEARIRTVQNRKNYKNWVREETKVAMKNRDNLRKTAAIRQDPASWKEYRRMRNICTKAVKNDRVTHLREQFDNAEKENNSKETHKLAKNLLGWNKDAAPDIFLQDGRMITSPQKMAQLQMEFFIEKVRKIRARLPAKRNHPLTTLKKAFQRWKDKDNLPMFKLSKISEIETLKLLNSMNLTPVK